jgi:hypothetical protein
VSGDANRFKDVNLDRDLSEAAIAEGKLEPLLDRFDRRANLSDLERDTISGVLQADVTSQKTGKKKSWRPARRPNKAADRKLFLQRWEWAKERAYLEANGIPKKRAHYQVARSAGIKERALSYHFAALKAQTPSVMKEAKEHAAGRLRLENEARLLEATALKADT